jgi:phosphoserine phosphatase RsbU/P
MTNNYILIIDSKGNNTDVIHSFLVSEGFQPIIAQTSSEAVKKAHEFSPQMIILYCDDPELNGLEVKKILEIEDDFSNVPVVFLCDQLKNGLNQYHGSKDIINLQNSPSKLIYDLQQIIRQYFPVANAEKQINILAAEDDIVIRRTLEALLQKNGYHNLRLATNGQEALELFQQNPPELLILDYLMPYLNGFDVLKEIRLKREFDYVPIIFLTAVDDKVKLIEALNAGATDYMTKPFDQAELLARVSTHARNYYLQKQLLEINKHLAKINKEISTKNIQIETDLRSAYKIQESLLPKEELTTDKMTINYFYRPCQSVGGDFLNYFQLDHNHIGFYIADVSGHGVTSAMITVFVREQIRNIVKKYEYYHYTPAQILKQLSKIYNEEIYFLENGVYFTIFFGIYNIQTQNLDYASAGHHALPVIISKDNAIVELKEIDLAIGFVDNFQYRDHNIKLKSQDRILLHTDGIIEISNKKGEFFGMERIKNFLLSNQNILGHNLLVKLVNESERFLGNYDQKDDIALMLITIL